MSEIFMLREILRIITPSEINDLTTTSDGESRSSLSEILDDELERFGLISEGLRKDADKILFFTKKRDFKTGNSCKRLLRFMGLLNQDPVVIEQNNRDKAGLSQKQKKNSKDNFLDARDGLRESQKKLKSVEVFQLYKKSSDINTEQVKRAKDDLSKSNNVGILINKKQA